LPAAVGTVRVAVIGTGPAACYTAETLLQIGAEVTMIDRQPVPGGLIRFGVAPDHPSTKRIGDSFAGLFAHPRLRMHLNVEVGKDVTHAELAAHHHAVVYAVGAAADKALGIPGEGLDGSMSATAFVAWYSAHPDVWPTEVDLSAERAVIIGNGNVAVDVARILLSDPDDLARTDIADHALKTLRSSNVREVVLLGRRGPEHAAFTRPEFLALQHLPGVHVVVDDHPEVRATIANAEPDSKAAVFADVDFERVDWDAARPEGKRIVFRFLSSPTELLGEHHVESLALSRNAHRGHDDQTGAEATGRRDVLPARLVLRSTGYRGRPIPDLPFDTANATVPNESGRVIDPEQHASVPGTYVVGWIKRGPSGGIGTNRTCAAETVDVLLDDAEARQLLRPVGTAKQFAALVRRRQPQSLGRREALAIDEAERARGANAGRPRVKFATVGDLVAAGKGDRRC
ncbi:MAG: FAD-dependent oxidoreductase, partial [Mycobacteriaceae bacterium]